MKLFRQSIIIVGIYLMGELLSKNFKLPIPGNIIGMLLLFILLCTNIVKVTQIEDVSNFLLDHLAFFFIPAGVGLLNSFNIVKDNFLGLIIICLLTTIVTIASTGLVAQYVHGKFKNKRKVVEKHEDLNW